jgi:large subunit ribosomal protein L10
MGVYTISRGFTVFFMALTKEKKEKVQKKVQDLLSSSETLVFVETSGLPVQDTQSMRSALKKEGVSYFVAKKTLIFRALSEKKYEGERPPLMRELALAGSKDSLASPREVFSFVKSTKEKVRIMGGVFEGRYVSKEEMLSIATIPTQHTLYAQFTNIINSPLQKFVVALSRIAEKKQ